MPRTLAGRISSGWLRPLLLAAIACGLTLACASQALAASFTPGNVVVYRVGNGGSLGGSAVPVFFDEFDTTGKLVQSVALPTAASGSNHRLTASGSATSEGLLTLSSNGQYLMATGYDAAVGTSKVGETLSASTPRTVARVSASAEVDTSTALTDFGNGNNPRGATSTDGTNLWVGGAGKSTTGGVHYAKLGASTSTLMSSSDTNARAVAIFNGQLYTSADPTKESNTISTVGSGTPTTSGQTTTNLPFATAPTQPYAFSLVTLGVGPGADTMYVADQSAGAIVKFGLSGGKWVKEGSVAVTSVTGVTADDINGTVTIYATTSGASGEGGVLYKITDSSGVGGTLAGSATQIATAPSGEAFRGVSFTPGTTFGSGGTPPPPAPTITPAETALPAAIGDPTNSTLSLKVADEGVEPSELTVTASSSNTSVAPSVEISGSGATRTLTVTPGSTVGHSTITLTVKAPGGGEASTTIDYGLSANQGDESDRYYAGAGNGSTAIDVGGGYMIVADDEGNVLRLYHERNSGEPTKTFDFTKVLPVGTGEADIETSARVGNTLYWMSSLSNKKSGKADPDRDIVFAASITGSGASTELTYVGSYMHLREDMVAWDEANGNPLGLAASAESGRPSNEADGMNAEGLEFAAGSSEEAYVAFRAPLEPPNDRKDALLVPVTNFASLVTHGNPGSTKATFGTPLEWNLGGLALREIRRNADGEFLAIAGTSDDSNSQFGLYTWDGNPADQPVLTETALSGVAEGAWESVVSVPDPIASGSTVELLEDNGETVWYADGLTSKTGMPGPLQKDIGRLFTIELPGVGTPGAPHLSAGSTPNRGEFALSWEASSTANVTYTLQQENALGGWVTAVSGLTSDEYAFASGSQEAEGTWSYRVIAVSGGKESEPSAVSSPVVVDNTAPNPPLVSADRPADFAGNGGWYKDSVTITFASGGDPTLADGSPGSGVDPASIPAPVTFETDGFHEAAGIETDFAGNNSVASSLGVQVDASAPKLSVECPASVNVGQSASATVSAADAQSGLASDPSGAVPIDTSKAGTVTTERSATDNVGHVATASCTTQVGHSQVITGTVKGKLVVKAGESVELTSTAKVNGVEVQSGGELDVNGASTKAIKSTGATSISVCGATVSGTLKIVGTSGSVVVGDGEACAASKFAHGGVLQGNTGGQKVIGNTFGARLSVTNGAGGTVVTGNTIAKALVVTGNTGEVTDTPNTVAGRSKIQGKKLR
ncbi:MAG TPA: hypothetical protein VMB05_02930 [Solirubrobacteraceae bacterium]|nr:hypothetical protein [Solirubrobacteraceae bacterium]